MEMGEARSGKILTSLVSGRNALEKSGGKKSK
jgi:hypothetical protein